MAISTKFIALSNGSIAFVRRGEPPMEVPGYDSDPGDPYLFHPILPECKARTFKKIAVPCCPDGKLVKHCTKFGYYSMPAQQCLECHRRGESVA